MAKQYRVHVSGSQVESNNNIDVQQFAGDQGRPVRIKAQAGVQYRLVELGKPKNAAPDHVKAKRNGANLEITFEDGKTPDLIVEDYYENLATGHKGLVGQGGDGYLYEYIPEELSVQAHIPELVDGAESIRVVLGGSDLAAFQLAGLPLTPVPLMTGLASAGAAVAGSVGGVSEFLCKRFGLQLTETRSPN